jgi:hypothetical protein
MKGKATEKKSILNFGSKSTKTYFPKALALPSKT